MSGFIRLVGQTPGTGTNDAAAAGNVGELITASVIQGSATSLSNATPKTVTSISLTAGDWDVSGTVYFTLGATTVVLELAAGISNTDNSLSGTAGAYTDIRYASGTVQANTGTDMGVQSPLIQKTLSATTTIYLIAYSQFSTSTNAAWGTIRARRVR